MKIKSSLLCITLTLSLVATLQAADPTEPKAAGASAEFEQMKTMVGKWAGQVDMGEGPVEMNLRYRLLAGGTVLEERCFPDTPNEMVTMYYDQDGKLAMTHYCVFGNRPAMKLKSWNGKTMKFDFDATCGINPAKESHMHALSLTFNDANTVTSSCVAMIDGKEQPEQPTVLRRVKE